jgi:hypothetical protein
MKKIEAEKMVERIEGGKVVRILPEDIDPIKPDDNGWDVEVTVDEN